MIFGQICRTKVNKDRFFLEQGSLCQSKAKLRTSESIITYSFLSWLKYVQNRVCVYFSIIMKNNTASQHAYRVCKPITCVYRFLLHILGQ